MRLLPLAALTLMIAAPSAAQTPAIAGIGEVRAVVLVDVVPPDRAAGLALLARYVADAGHDPNVLSMELFQQDAIPNHFILEEAFADRDAYQRFVAEPRVRTFRAALFPHLGSPWDERRGTAPGR